VNGSPWPVVPGLVVAGMGLSLLVIPLVNVVLAAVPAEVAGGASGLFSRAGSLRLRRFDRRRKGVRVVTIDIGDYLPVIPFKALRGVVPEPARDLAINGNPIVVIEHDQFAEPNVPAIEQASWETPSIRQPSPANTYV